MRTSALGNAAAGDIQEQIEEKFLTFFDDEDELRWAITLSDEIEDDREELWNIFFSLRSAEFHLQSIDDDTARENGMRDVFQMVEHLRDMIWELEQELDYHEDRQSSETPGEQTEPGEQE